MGYLKDGLRWNRQGIHLLLPRIYYRVLINNNNRKYIKMNNYKTEQGNTYYIDGVFAFVSIGATRLTYWESKEELENWIDSQY